MKILVVEDEQDILNMTKIMISKVFGLECIGAENGIEGIKKFMEYRDDILIIFTDQLMPGMNGSQFANEIKKICPEVPIFLMTGFAPSYINDKLNVFDQILQKPITARGIELIVRQSCRNGKIQIPFTRSQTGTEKTLDEVISELSLIQELKKKRMTITPELRSDFLQGIVEILDGIYELYSEFLSLKRKMPGDEFIINRTLSELTNSLLHCRYILILYKTIFNGICSTSSKQNISLAVKSVLQILGIEFNSEELNSNINIETDIELFEAGIYSLFLYLSDFLGNLSPNMRIDLDWCNKTRVPIMNIAFSTMRSKEKQNERKVIALIDDDCSYSKLLNTILLKNQYDVFVYNSGYDFFDFFEQEILPEPDLVILDVQMKGMSGMEVLKNFRRMKKYAHVPIIIVSGHPKVLSGKFQTFLGEFHPVRTFHKNPVTSSMKDLVKIIGEVLSKKYAYFEFSDLFKMNLEDSIKSDHIIGLGLKPVSKIFSYLGITIKFKEDIYDRKISIKFSERGNVEQILESNDSTISCYYFDKMNEYVRHDLKNKIGSLSYKVKELRADIESSEQINSPIKIKYHHNQIEKIFEILTTLEGIKQERQ